MNVLGISCFSHDAAASLVQNGKVVAAAMEERFTRKKHDVGFPINAIIYCLQRGGVDADALDAIAFYEDPYLKFERVLYRHIDAWPHSKDVFVRSIGSWLTSKLPIRRTIRRSLRGFPTKCRIYTVQHHLSHAASAYYCSPFTDAAILTIDGVGDRRAGLVDLGHAGLQISSSVR